MANPHKSMSRKKVKGIKARKITTTDCERLKNSAMSIPFFYECFLFVDKIQPNMIRILLTTNYSMYNIICK